MNDAAKDLSGSFSNVPTDISASFLMLLKQADGDFLHAGVDPDVILLQEVQHPAAGAKGKGAPESSGAKRHRLGGWTSDHKAGSDVINSGPSVCTLFSFYRSGQVFSCVNWKRFVAVSSDAGRRGV